MNITAHLHQFESIANDWMMALDTYDERKFNRAPDQESWSIGQVYYHLVHGTQNFHLRMVRQCMDNPDHAHEKKTFPGKIVFF
ncbi:MAG TPA: DinB family protein, partial [bacterium]|nr:DinB family protein [bacterium]